MKKYIILLLSLLLMFSSLSCKDKKKENDFDYKESYTEAKENESITEDIIAAPDEYADPGNCYINVSINEDNGYDLYKAPAGLPGYRYGPSFIVYEDGSIDAWFASGGSGLEQWDWIAYKHYDGKSWSEEKCVLQPTPNSFDHYSCCDPGVIYTNGYYYLGYTSTLNENQGDNNLFVARSKNPDGPYEKWNGSGWGGNSPMPIVYFSEDQSLWGIGEASFVELDGTLYLYYTNDGSSGRSTMIATADATDENWPLTLETKGVALENGDCDALDVKYVDEYERFLAVASEQRLTDNSFLSFYESRDGITFTKVDVCKRNVYEYCHNPGISGSENGHILKDRPAFIAYAYGPEWGVWNTRMQSIELSLTDNLSFLENSSKNLKVGELPRDTRDSYSLDYVGISGQSKCVITAPVTQQYVILRLAACKLFHDQWTDLHNLRTEVELYGYDESIIKRTGESSLMFEVIGVGETMVTAEFRGHLTYVYVIIHEEGATGKMVALKPLAYDMYVLDRSTDLNYLPQIKSMAVYDDGSWEMVWDPNTQGIFYNYDKEAIEVDKSGHIIPKKAGTHIITVCCGEYSYDLSVNVILPDLSLMTFEKGALSHELFGQLNNTETEIGEDGELVCVATVAEDPFVCFNMSKATMNAEDYSSISLRYKLPMTNALPSYSAQIFFKCKGQELSETTSQRVTLVSDGEYHTATFELDDKDYWTGEVELIRVDYFDSCQEQDVFYMESLEFTKAIN
ncbi:MAG: hypothetical protein E7652_08060 [Ruminococcaceae bacterium]|nr:hypothetical protein [Oscillospiraceae bacterium]